ncbi:NOI protein, nitrate-induced [Musa troglodytarum]|uniref:NOI protein, nitrate-induced n=1 Tax=Musa troglodytarum TaxID=320322 RepID=A0A9E7GVU1_9LILI|nr:NOI protein, nitrate-induced [Musa troglodytarum]
MGRLLRINTSERRCRTFLRFRRRESRLEQRQRSSSVWEFRRDEGEGLAEKEDLGMAAEVSSTATTLGAHKEEAEGESELVTRDLLGGGAAGDVDLQLHVPAGWPTRIDLAVLLFPPLFGSFR